MALATKLLTVHLLVNLIFQVKKNMNKNNTLKISGIIFLTILLFISSCKKAEDNTYVEVDAKVRADREYKYYTIQDVMPPRIVPEGILFTFADSNESIELSGDFNNWQYAIPLQKGYYGVYYYLLQEELKAGKYLYRYRINGVWINDPLATNLTYNNHSQEISYFEILNDMNFYDKNPMYNSNNTVTFYYSNMSANEVMFTSDKLGFNSTRYPMKKDLNGIWTITIAPEEGNYYYNFVVDKKWEVDPINMNVVKGSDERLHSHSFIRYSK